jgi:Fe-Mn family superoxide dismutase
VEQLLINLESLNVDESVKTAIRNHGGGHANHSLFWQIMGPEKEIDEGLVADIEATFGAVEEFKKQFTDTASKVFGSGWAWLARDENGKLHLHGMPNQDSPYLHGHTPVIGLDVWEHAYYLKYQNRRPEYIEAWWNVLKVI